MYFFLFSHLVFTREKRNVDSNGCPFFASSSSSSFVCSTSPLPSFKRNYTFFDVDRRQHRSETIFLRYKSKSLTLIHLDGKAFGIASLYCVRFFLSLNGWLHSRQPSSFALKAPLKILMHCIVVEIENIFFFRYLASIERSTLTATTMSTGHRRSGKRMSVSVCVCAAGRRKTVFLFPCCRPPKWFEQNMKNVTQTRMQKAQKKKQKK